MSRWNKTSHDTEIFVLHIWSPPYLFINTTWTIQVFLFPSVTFYLFYFWWLAVHLWFIVHSGILSLRSSVCTKLICGSRHSYCHNFVSKRFKMQSFKWVACTSKHLKFMYCEYRTQTLCVTAPFATMKL